MIFLWCFYDVYDCLWFFWIVLSFLWELVTRRYTQSPTPVAQWSHFIDSNWTIWAYTRSLTSSERLLAAVDRNRLYNLITGADTASTMNSWDKVRVSFCDDRKCNCRCAIVCGTRRVSNSTPMSRHNFLYAFARATEIEDIKYVNMGRI